MSACRTTNRTVTMKVKRATAGYSRAVTCTLKVNFSNTDDAHEFGCGWMSSHLELTYQIVSATGEDQDMPDSVKALITKLCQKGFTPVLYHCTEDWWGKAGDYIWTAPLTPSGDDSAGAKRTRF